MLNRENLEYVRSSATIYFERGHVACAYCPLLETYARNQCRMTGEYIIDTKYTVGWKCPLNIEQPEGIENE